MLSKLKPHLLSAEFTNLYTRCYQMEITSAYESYICSATRSELIDLSHRMIVIIISGGGGL